jgi:hypothetical protein
MRTLSGEFIAWMGQAAGDAWAQYLRDSSACIQKLKGLDLGPAACCAGECDPAFGAFLSDINRLLVADLLSCPPPGNCTHGRKRPPRRRDTHKPPSDRSEPYAPHKPDGALPCKDDPEKGA